MMLMHVQTGLFVILRSSLRALKLPDCRLALCPFIAFLGRGLNVCLGHETTGVQVLTFLYLGIQPCLLHPHHLALLLLRAQDALCAEDILTNQSAKKYLSLATILFVPSTKYNHPKFVRIRVSQNLSYQKTQ